MSSAGERPSSAEPFSAGPGAPAIVQTAELAANLATITVPWAHPAWEAPRADVEPVLRAAPEPEPAGGASELKRQEAIVLDVLERYARALERLDVQAAKAVWPTLNARDLRRAFHQLDSQQVRLTGCGVSISGQAANAHCRGDATYQPKVGTRPLRLPSRDWRFDLSRHDDGWHIVHASIQ